MHQPKTIGMVDGGRERLGGRLLGDVEAPRIACELVVIAVAGAIRAMFITKEYGYGLLGSLEAHENPKPADGGHVDLLRS